jgi:hypothetical protein
MKENIYYQPINHAIHALVKVILFKRIHVFFRISV